MIPGLDTSRRVLFGQGSVVTSNHESLYNGEVQELRYWLARGAIRGLLRRGLG